MIEISSQIIVGVPAKPMSASTKRNFEKRISGAQDGMGSLASIEHSLMDTRDSAGRVHRAFSDGPLEGKEEHKMHNSMCGPVRQEIHMLALKFCGRNPQQEFLPV